MKIYDEEIWNSIDVEDLWIYDKLILSKKLGHTCGPAGIDLPFTGTFIVKPITNILGMGRGAYIETFNTVNTDHLPAGSFWMEYFTGKYLTVDVVRGKIDVVLEGVQIATNRFAKWTKVENVDIHIPSFIIELSHKYDVVNFESIGGKITECHLRHNPDWIKYKARELVPVWEEQYTNDVNFVWDKVGDRLGFLVYGK